MIIVAFIQNIVKSIIYFAISTLYSQVAALSGDARRCLDICRRAVEIAETQNESKEQQSIQNSVEASVKRKSLAKKIVKDSQKSTTDNNNNKGEEERVGMKHVEMALKEMFSSPKILALQSLSLMEEMFMKAIISEFRRSGLEEAQFTDVSFVLVL